LTITLIHVALQLHASASTLRLVTFDADGTLYADGAHMAQVRHVQNAQSCIKQQLYHQ
jgi:FMN phosphatase YigB (HAD superfamily)